MSGSGGFTTGVRRTFDGVRPEASFLASEQYQSKRAGATFAQSVVAPDQNGNRILKAGTFVTEITSGPEIGKYGPYVPAVDEVQTLTITGAPTGGSFTLTYAGQTTNPIPWNATAEQVRAALVALSNIGEFAGDNVYVTGGPLPATAVVIRFTGALGGKDVALITDTSSLTGGTTPDAAVATTTAGGAGAAPSDGRQTPSDNTSGYLPVSINLRDGDVVEGVYIACSVLSARVFPTPDATIKAAVKGRITFQ
jgi:hypothetical protein